MNIKLNKAQTKLFSLGDDNQIKLWLLNDTFLKLSSTNSSAPSSSLYKFKVPDLHIPLGNFDIYSSLTANVSPNSSSGGSTNAPSLSHGRTYSNTSYDFHKKFTCLGTLMSFDTSDNTVFLSSRNGIILYKIPAGLRLVDQNNLEQIEIFKCDNVTTIDLWNATHSCILLAGCLDGRIRVFKLLNH